MRPPLSCCAVLLSTLAFAAEPAAPATPALNRLFFTAAERDELDRIRVGVLDNSDARHARTLELNGIVQKNGEPPLLWINGSRYKGHDIAGARIAPAALSASTMLISMPAPDPREMVLKVGQTLDPAGGNLREVYQRPPQELNQLLQLLSRRGPPPPQKAEGKDKGKAPPDGKNTPPKKS
ncbi:hypothetical protein FNU76_09110 [Chitinimonas arctica]|uniref:Uncharacterized protein n=1 Tax=Chitinimonas arctica TaxID=2594795 RepID=A0A516SEC6_9NEIS|nr:hypothetical protein [Chitinimonas arctica]QDQ26515.1 hypothetical protein FNU76_09110 [Chitinimonas arctica]